MVTRIEGICMIDKRRLELGNGLQRGSLSQFDSHPGFFFSMIEER